VRADEVESEVWKGRLTRCFRERPDWLLRLRRGGSFPGVTASP
jgi:hypothetical protein